MPYNKQTAIRNQKDFLRSNLHCGYPAIEKRARETLTIIEENERKQAEFNARIKAVNTKLTAERAEKDLKKMKQQSHTKRKTKSKKKR